MTHFITKFDALRHFSKSPKQDLSVFGDFNNDIKRHHQDRINFENLFSAYDLEVHYLEPNRKQLNLKTASNTLYQM